MKVQEMIDALMKIEDKESIVYYHFNNGVVDYCLEVESIAPDYLGEIVIESMRE
jgi:hypothetical protein